MTVSWLRMDLSPLASRDFRVLFGSSTVTLLGTEATDVALVVQVKQLTGSTLVALVALVLAGAADMVSGIFRDLLWKQTVPDALRGRLAGVELLSYALGPSAGQLRAGTVASLTTPRISLTSGGLLCVAAVGLVCLAFPGFTAYRSPVTTDSENEKRATVTLSIK